MSAGSKIKDDKQEYQYTIPWVTPGGHEFTFYDTPENERLVIKHSSGSRLEFKADGSVFLTAIKDMHTHASILSSASESAQAADSTTIRYDTDLNLVVQGRLSIKAKSLDLECGEYAKTYAGTDFTIQGNNIIEKATEAISLEGTKAIHVDTKTYTERSVTHTTEEGTKEDGTPGGLSILKVHGNALIQNDDPTGRHHHCFSRLSKSGGRQGEGGLSRKIHRCSCGRSNKYIHTESVCSCTSRTTRQVHNAW
jgi:hypothetical protein